MTNQAKSSLILSALALIIPFYYLSVSVAVSVLYEDYATGREVYLSYVLLGESIVSVMACVVLSLTSSFFGFRTLRFSKNNRTAALGLALGVTPLLFAAIFTWWML